MSAAHDGQLEIVRDARGFLRARAPAHVTFQWLLDAIDSVAQFTRQRGDTRLLLDLTAIVRVPGLVEQSILGEHTAQELAHCLRVASVVADGTRTGVSQAVANRLGLEYQVFTSEARAIEWLLE